MANKDFHKLYFKHYRSTSVLRVLLYAVLIYFF